MTDCQSSRKQKSQVKSFVVDTTLHDGAENVVFSNHSNNIVAGLLGRCLYTYDPTTKTYVSIIQPIHNVFKGLTYLKNRLTYIVRLHAGRQVLGKCTDKDNFLKLVPSHKKKLYARVWDELLILPVHVKDALIKIFVKAEKKKLKPGKLFPRLIYPRNTRYVVALAKFLKPLEHPIYHAIDNLYQEYGCVGNVVMKNLNSNQIGLLIKNKWERFADPVFVGFDMSHFDKHVSKQALEFEHSLYNSLIKDTELKTLLRWQLNNKFVAISDDNKIIRASRAGGRMSGDINTSLGNVIIVTMLSLHYLKRFATFDFINAGDDSGVIIEREDLHKLNALEEYFGKYGFSMKIEDPVYVLEKIVFCQTQPVWNGEQHAMVRQIQTSFMKDSACLLHLRTEHEYKSWKHEVATAGKLITQGIPILPYYYKFMDPGTHKNNNINKHYATSGMMMMANGLKLRKQYRDISMESRLSFFLAFGIEPAYQRLLEIKFQRSPKTKYDFSDAQFQSFEHIDLTPML